MYDFMFCAFTLFEQIEESKGEPKKSNNNINNDNNNNKNTIQSVPVSVSLYNTLYCKQLILIIIYEAFIFGVKTIKCTYAYIEDMRIIRTIYLDEMPTKCNE